MKIVTFNIRCDFGQDGDNCFEFRKPLIAKTLHAEQPDILCFQEVLPHQAAWLREILNGYTVVGCGREADLSGEQMTVAFKSTAFQLIELETVWLSETPDVPGSRYPEQSTCPRCFTEVLLQDIAVGQLLRVVNTHLDHIGALPRALGLKQILQKLNSETRFSDAAVILCGDMNAAPDSPEMDVMRRAEDFSNASQGIGITFHGFTPDVLPECIDYIFLRGCIAAESVVKWTHCENGVWLSDHYPVCAELKWTK